MIRLFSIAFVLILFNAMSSIQAFAEHQCTKSITCSDGAILISKECTSSYDIVIINGHRIDTNGDGGPGHHHGDDLDSTNTTDTSNTTPENQEPQDDPYGRHHHRHHPIEPPVDPCSNGHGHMIDDGSVINPINSLV